MVTSLVLVLNMPFRTVQKTYKPNSLTSRPSPIKPRYSPRSVHKKNGRRDKSTVQCFKYRKFGHYRYECREEQAPNLIDAARAQINELGGNPNTAAAQVLYELVVEEMITVQSKILKMSTTKNKYAVFSRVSSLQIPQLILPVMKIQ